MQEQTSYNKLIGVLTHILVWAVFGLAIFYYQPVISDYEVPSQFWIKQTIELVLLVIIFYINAKLLVPGLLLKNHLAAYFVIILAVILGVLFANRSLDNAYADYQEQNHIPFRKLMRPSTPPMPSRLIPGRHGGGTTLTITITALVLGISTALTVIEKWQKDNQERKALEQEKLSSELSFLKAQINPHFFFNTLNNIYALTAVNPKVAGEAIHQLSKMMRYLLYDTQQGQNMLSDEISFVKNYISLMKLRLTDVASIHLSVPEDLQDMPLAPMILLPFIENAFKHGISATQPSFIDIVIFQKGKLLGMKVNNSILKDNAVSLDTNSGIGLVNTRRRLDLLYPDKYKLDICESKEDNKYSVHLVIDLS